MRALAILAALASPALAGPAPKKAPPKAPQKTPKTAEQKEADRHFKSGVALFNESKFAEALAEFQRAYEIAPAPIVLLNIAACHRELSQYGDAVKFYNRFLTEGEGKVPAPKLASAKTELDAILARIARVTIATTPSEGVALTLDGNPLPAPVEMPLILAPGEHKLVAHLDGHKDAERTLRVASGDEVDVELKLPELPPEPMKRVEPVQVVVPVAPQPGRRRFRIGAAFGTNLRAVGDTGAPDLSIGVALSDRAELAVDAIFIAYAVMPSLRVRLAGDVLAINAILAVPVAFSSMETFVAGAGGLGVRFQATPAFALRIEGYASFATKGHGVTFPAFVGGEVWF